MTERQNKKAQFEQKESSGKKLLVPILVVALVIAGAAGWLLFGAQSSSHAAVKVGADGKVRLAANDFADGKARFYRLDTQSGEVKFFVVRSGDGVIRAALDTCDVCYRERKGYRQEGNDMICNNCDQHFRTDLVNVVKGGCNPAPLRRQQVNGQVVIAAADIERGAGYFRATK